MAEGGVVLGAEELLYFLSVFGRLGDLIGRGVLVMVGAAGGVSFTSYCISPG